MAEPMVPLYVRLPASLRERLNASAISHSRPLSWEVRRLLEEGLPIDLTPAGTPLKVPPLPPEAIEEVERAKKAREKADAGPLVRGAPNELRRVRTDPEPINLGCKHPRDQRTPYGVCKACKREVQP